jgi:LDH2 family malate/lactate/ureidoglycolate dehydrogenase
MIGLRNCGHLGRVGDWAEMAAADGQVSLHFLNTSGRSASRRSAAATGASRRIRSRSGYRSTTPIR